MNLNGRDIPRRGTVEFMNHAASSDEPFPSYWSLDKSKVSSKTIKNFLVDVDPLTKEKIEKLVEATWQQHLVGMGSDAKGLEHTNIKVVRVQRIENGGLFQHYGQQRKQLLERMCREGRICPDIGQLPGSSGRVVTTEDLPDCMKKELYYEVNEHYLFHGTKVERIGAFMTQGFKIKKSSKKGMFGNGIYTAETSTKADQYTDSKEKRRKLGWRQKLILSRVLLGNVFVCDKARNFTQPKTCYNSVMGDGKWLFREFVVYEKNHCYPEYVITYKRYK